MRMCINSVHGPPIQVRVVAGASRDLTSSHAHLWLRVSRHYLCNDLKDALHIPLGWMDNFLRDPGTAHLFSRAARQ